MKPPLRIAILECDTPVPAVVEQYGKYGRIFSTLLESAAQGLGLSPTKDLDLSVFDVVTAQEYPNLENIDAVLISGSSRWTIGLRLSINAYRAQNITLSTMMNGS